MGTRNDVGDLVVHGDREVVPFVLRGALDRARPSLHCNLPVNFGGYVEIWNLDPLRTFLQLTDLAKRRDR